MLRRCLLGSVRIDDDYGLVQTERLCKCVFQGIMVEACANVEVRYSLQPEEHMRELRIEELFCSVISVARQEAAPLTMVLHGAAVIWGH
jgi:hypothetical protein